jgi:capsular exopolysaccharide synthesis family protein
MMEQYDGSPEPVGMERPAGQNHLSLVRVAWQRKPLVALGLVIGLVIGAFYYAQRTPVYQSTAQVLVIKKRPEALPLPGTDPRLSSYEDYLATHVALVRSQLIVERAVTRDGLKGLPSLHDEGGTVSSIIRNLTVARERETGGSSTNILTLTFRCSGSEDCGKVVNAVIHSYKEFLEETYKDVSDETVKLITQARDVLEKELGEKEVAYVEFRKKSPPLWKSKDGFNLSQARLADIEAKRSLVQMRQAEIRGRLQAIDKALASQRSPAELLAMIDEWTTRATPERTTGTELNRHSPKEIEEQLLPLLLEEETLKSSYGPDYPPLKSVRKRIELARAMLPRVMGVRDQNGDPAVQAREAMRQYQESLKQELGDSVLSDKTLAELSGVVSEEAQKLAAYEVEDIKFTNDIARTKQLYEGIIKRLQEVGFAKDFGGYDARIVSAAAPGKKVEPRASLVFSLAALLGLLSGLGLGYLGEITDKSFRTPEEIRRRLGLPIIGHIPLFTGDAREQTGDVAAALDPSMYAFYQSRSAEAEAFRGVRTALYFSTAGQGHKVIQVTSPSPGDGKTTVTGNLAISMAQSGKRVLLIDADIRKPRLHRQFGIGDETGLSLVLAGEVEPAEAIQEGGVPNLSILPCGPLPPNPAELLTSPRLKEFLDQVREQYDFVLVDTPPLLAVTDASVVAARVDGVLLVIRVSKNGRPQAVRAKEILNTLGASMLGVVVNALDHRAEAVYGFEHYHYGNLYGSAEVQVSERNGTGAALLEPSLVNGTEEDPIQDETSNPKGVNGSASRGLFGRFFRPDR